MFSENKWACSLVPPNRWECLKKSADDILIFFPEKQALTFPFIQTICIKCQSIFSEGGGRGRGGGGGGENIILSSAEFVH